MPRWESSSALAVAWSTLLVVALAAALSMTATAQGSSGPRVWCDMFHVAYAENTSCATELRVARVYSARCVPRSVTSAPLPACTKSILGFHCKPTGDIYAVVRCHYGRRRVGLHLAE